MHNFRISRFDRDLNLVASAPTGATPWHDESELGYARRAEAQQIVDYLAHGTSVSIVGQHWSGRTELLRRAAEALQGKGFSLIQLRGIEHSYPLEAFKVAFPQIRAHHPSETQLTLKLPGAITELLDEGPAAMLIDDIDLLDEASWALLEQIHKETGVPVVATAESRGDIKSDEQLLIRIAQPVVKLTLEGLRLDMMHDLLEERIGGQVSPSMSARIHTKSGGLPGYAVAFVDSAMRRAKIRKQGNVWQDGPDLWSQELEGAFESLIYRYPHQAREALEMMVIAGPLTLQQATELVGQEEVERLESYGLVRLTMAGSVPRVNVNPPGISDYFRHRAPSVRSARLRERVEDALGADFGTECADEPQTHQQCSELIPNAELPLVAREFSDRFEIELNRTWRKWSDQPTLRNGIEALELRLTGEAPVHQIEAILSTTEAAADPLEKLYFRYLHARWLLTQRQPFQAIEKTLAGSTDLGYPAVIEALSIGFRAEQHEITNGMLTRMKEISELSGIDGEVGTLIYIAMNALAGRPETALEQLTKLPDSGWTSRYAPLLRGLVLMTAGHPQEAYEWASFQIKGARERFDRSAVVGHVYIAVMALLSMRRYTDATIAGSVVAGGKFRAMNLLFSPDRALMNALGVAAWRSGRTSSVAPFLDQGKSCRGRGDAVPMGAQSFPATFNTEIESSPEEASAAYLGLAAQLRKRGYDSSAVGPSMLAILLNFDIDTATAKRVKLEPFSDSVFLAYLDARIAYHHGDAEEIVKAARSLQCQQAHDSALNYFLAAVKLHRAAGNEQRAAEIREEAEELLPSQDLLLKTRLTKADASLTFTQREKEIIDLIAQGMTNPAIASALKLSVRTIETHIRNIRRKSGGLEREEMSYYATNTQQRAGLSLTPHA